MNKKMMYSNGGYGEVTEKTDKQANKLVKKRTKVRDKRTKIKSKDKKTKLGKFIKKTRLKMLDKKEERIQRKINKNPTAQKWRRDGQKKKKKILPKKGFKNFLDNYRNVRDDRKYKTGGFKKDSWIEEPRATLFED
tara:strand:+ start:170 stop:577 length:408 start_codon:yes stop_codon:yes gene_type:complete